MALETLRSRIAGKELFARAAEYDSEGNKISTSLESKQDVISDIEEIRSGAAAGATAYQKPNTGIPSSDMTSEVQTSLGLADSAVQPAALAPEYDSTATYAAGDHCMHLGKYYRCDTAISTAEAWTPAHWTETNIIGDLSTVLTSKAGASGGTELSLVTTGEKYTWNNWTSGSVNIPPINGVVIAGRKYEYKKFGDREWMMESLKFDTSVENALYIRESTGIYYYKADYVFNNAEFASIIPSGWRIPTIDDRYALVRLAGGANADGATYLYNNFNIEPSSIYTGYGTYPGQYSDTWVFGILTLGDITGGILIRGNVTPQQLVNSDNIGANGYQISVPIRLCRDAV